MTITNNQHFDDEGCPMSGRYAAKRANGETLGTCVATDERNAYDQFEQQGVDLHYVRAL